MRRILLATAFVLGLAAPAAAQTEPGKLSANRYAPDSTANAYGAGSPYRPDSIHNPYGVYGSPYSPRSATNPYSHAGAAPLRRPGPLPRPPQHEPLRRGLHLQPLRPLRKPVLPGEHPQPLRGREPLPSRQPDEPIRDGLAHRGGVGAMAGRGKRFVLVDRPELTRVFAGAGRS